MLEIKDLEIAYRSHGGLVRAVDGVSLTVRAGQTLGLVGESGCGKSSLARAVMRLVEPAAGTIRWNGRDATAATGRDLAEYRSSVQMIFQDPSSSMDPRFSVSRIIDEPLTVDRTLGKLERRARVAALMDDVGLATHLKDRYPHELSGGQRQRVAIARALALKPKLVVLDEAVSALDVSLQAQILNLLVDLQREHGLAYLFVSHDIGVVEHISDAIAVMYLGKIVETGDHEQVVHRPAHPYTQALMRAVPVMDPRRRSLARKDLLGGDVPSPFNPPPGCAFHTRCPLASEICRRETPELRPVAEGRTVACHEVERLLRVAPKQDMRLVNA
ncbi:MAG: oligopeptide/dipeptide ABC transporter ATP-binding protein [Microvirga sp.]